MQGYRYAINWLVDNDDMAVVIAEADFAEQDRNASIAVALTADLFHKTEAQVLDDLLREIKKRGW
jgi:hypothetical protein